MKKLPLQPKDSPNKLSTKSNDEPQLSIAKAKKFNIMQLVEHIVTATKGHKLSLDTIKLASPAVQILSERLSLSQSASVLLSVLINQSDDESIRIADIASHFSCNNTTIMCYNSDLEALATLRYIKVRKRDSKLTYRLPLGVIDSLRKDTPYCPPQTKNLTLEEFITHLETIFDEIDNDNIPIFDSQQLFDDLIADNLHLSLCKSIHNRIDSNDWGNLCESTILLFLIHSEINKDDNRIYINELESIINCTPIYNRIKHSLKASNHPLLIEGLIENKKENEMGSRDLFSLTSKSKIELLAELGLTENSTVTAKELILHTTIGEKSLFYNDSQRSQIDQLALLLENEHFTSIQERLGQHNMRKGFACLFYGAPGTGKTETVYQIARRCGRDIMTVDVSQIKSMWVGESEKNINQLFERYAALSKKSDRSPILLFNEADAVLGIRQQGAERAVDKMENSIQNIILQQMENLDGIMIATTNLTQNLDSAFERRFIFKIEFERPTTEAKCAIWHSMIPSLGCDQIDQLARLYDFSGGQIENIARKRTIDSILNGGEVTFEQMQAFCQAELIVKGTPRRPIGY